MELLTWLTVGYLVILVLTLAIGLILILLTLASVAEIVVFPEPPFPLIPIFIKLFF